MSTDPRAAQYLVRSEEALEQGAYTAALVLADSAGRYAPELADVPFLRARILTALQRVDEAEAEYKRVLDLDPEYQGVWLNMGNAAYRQNQFAEALRHYRSELDVHAAPEVWHAIGRAYEQQRLPDSARYAYEQSLKLDSTYAVAYLRLGQLHKEAGDLEQAVSVSRRGLELDPGNVDYQYALGALLVLTGRDAEAVQLLQSVVAERPWHYWANYNLGRALVRAGQPDKGQEYLDHAEHLQNSLAAIQFWQGLAQSNPDQLMLWVKLAEALREAGREAEALEADKVATALAPRYTAHRFADPAAAEEDRLAMLDLVNGNPDAAISRYRKLVSAHPELVDAWLNLGVAYAVSGHVEEAQSSWETAQKHQPDNPVARAFLVQLAQSHVQVETQPRGAGAY